MTKKLPKFESDEAIADFLENTDLSEYMTKENLRTKNFEFLPKDKKVSMRFADNFLGLVKNVAGEQGISYQKYIRMAVEEKLQQDLSQHR